MECKLVCKPWRDLIHLPSFSQKHLNHLNSASDDDSGKLNFVFLHGVINDFSYDEYDENSDETPFGRKERMNVNLPFYEHAPGYSFAGSCNGLICLHSFRKHIYGPTYIFNPITREYIIFPTSKENYWWTGFGYTLSTNEYKVVRVYADSNVQVYTLGSSTGWRNLGTIDMNVETFRKDAGAFANGALHWADNKGTILVFHLSDEKFRKLPPPPWFTPSGYLYFPISLGVFGDFSSATYYRYSFSGKSEIWLLKKNRDNYNDLRWRKEFSLEDVNILRHSSPFGFTKSGRLLCYEHHTLYGYDPEASSAKMDVNFGKTITASIPHRNTLVSLNVLGEKDAKIMESGETTSSSEEAENSDKLKKPQNEAIDL
ncbi:F-box protein At3g07870-like [Papaver somniferum]|uniref:F-box protein At3g07870-like n=1 Tax=Papaver somniferum TaxID=3469 RepID=UPI000E7049BC|nr:F-box protein At3g07870-like [Papaver somniferum]